MKRLIQRAIALSGAGLIVVLLILTLGCRVGKLSPHDGDNYVTQELTHNDFPSWNPTNAIPLSPDKAVIIAMDYVNARQAHQLSWDVDDLEIKKYSSDTPWFYIITLVDTNSGNYHVKIVRVFMDGKVWEPQKE